MTEHVADIEIPCGYMNYTTMSLRMDGTLEWSFDYNTYRRFVMDCTPRDLKIAVEYSEHCQDYAVAERRMYRVLYQRGCIKPNHPLPAKYQPLAGNYYEFGWRTAENGWNVESIYSMLGM